MAQSHAEFGHPRRGLHLPGWLLFCFLPLLAAECPNIQAEPDTRFYEEEAQVARSTAGLLSVIREDVTPAQLLEILNLNLRQSPRIFGSAIAFEPDSYPFVNGTLVPSYPPLIEGVPSYSGDYVWAGATEPNTLVPQEVWSGERRVLYAPYVARGGIVMDLADSYNYFTNYTEWYQEARTKFINGELSFLEGVWGSPYFDEGAGEICMITYSVPFKRISPVPAVPVPSWLDTSLYGLPESRALDTAHGIRYFWGIATVDIDLSIVSFTCDPLKGAKPGSFFNEATRTCEQCAAGTQLKNNACVACSEYEYSADDRSDCIINELYFLYGFFFHLWLAIVILPAGLKLQRRFYILGVKHDDESGGFIVQLCNKHGIHVSSSRKVKAFPRLYLHGTGHPVLDRPHDIIHFKVFSEDQLQLLWIPKSTGDACQPKAASDSFHEPLDESDRAPVMHLNEFSMISGYVRFGFLWELLHITMCRVPILMWLAPPFGFTVGTLVLWRVQAFSSGSGALLGIISTLFMIFFWLGFIIAARCIWEKAATHKQRKRHLLLNERSLIEKLEQSCWEKDQTKENEARVELLKIGREAHDIKQLTDNIQRRQSQEAGVSVAYLRSEDFLKEVYARGRPEDPSNYDPTFYALKDAFFYGEDPMPLGKDRICPRDGRYGCALVDTLSPRYRRKSTHYLSWTWKYTVSMVQDALQCLLDEMNKTPDDIFLYMCFFVNNQYRILFEKEGVGSSNLEHVFESTLSRIGHMVAILDDWYGPVYLTRIWTIFEQFTAIKLGNVKVTMVLPHAQNQSLIQQIREGEDGIRHVTQCLCKFQSKNATAFSPADEANVKALIRSTIGFREVDRRIEQFMLNWVGNVVQEYMKSLMVYVSVGENNGKPFVFKSEAVASDGLPCPIEEIIDEPQEVSHDDADDALGVRVDVISV